MKKRRKRREDEEEFGAGGMMKNKGASLDAVRIHMVAEEDEERTNENKTKGSGHHHHQQQQEVVVVEEEGWKKKSEEEEENIFAAEGLKLSFRNSERLHQGSTRAQHYKEQRMALILAISRATAAFGFFGLFLSIIFAALRSQVNMIFIVILRGFFFLPALCNHAWGIFFYRISSRFISIISR